MPDSSSLPLLPASAARAGFSPRQVADFHAAWNWQDLLKSGDVSLYMSLRLAEFYPSTRAHRSGPVVALERALDPRIGSVRIPASDNKSQDQSLDQYLANPGSRAQGMVVIHRGKIAYESYPGMREDDAHITMSVAKPMPGLLIALLEQGGEIDILQGVGSFVAALKDTAWSDIPVVDVLNMRSGLDIEESEQTRVDPQSSFSRFLRAVLGVPGPDGKIEKHTDVIRAATRLREPGQCYEYSSINTQVLVLLAEAIEQQPWAKIFQERVWSKLNVEGDLEVCTTPDGLAMAFGLASMRLRDLARFGMLYTPSWNKAAREPVVSSTMIEKSRASVPPPLRSESTDVGSPSYSAWQWEKVFTNGAIFKGGLHGQGLYISPEDDLVIAWFSTTPASELLKYALAIGQL